MRYVPRRIGFDLFDDLFDDSFFRGMTKQETIKTDIREKDGQYFLEMELPGFKKEEIEAGLKDGYLTISATHNDTEEDKGEKGHYVRKERHSVVKRSFYVGEAYTEEDIKGSFENGILTLSLPKEEPKKIEEKKRIAIE